MEAAAKKLVEDKGLSIDLNKINYLAKLQDKYLKRLEKTFGMLTS